MLVANGYNQQATYWGAPTQDGYGAWHFSAPQSLLVRWENTTEEFVDQQGADRISRAIVWIPETLDPEIGGYLYLGDSAEADPTTLKSAWAIQRVDEIPDLRGLTSETRAYL